MVDGIRSVNNYNDYNKINKTQKTQKAASTDSVKISSEAMDMIDKKRVLDLVNQAPDVRADKVAAAKAKLQDPNYINDTLINNLAEKLLSPFGG